jgi:hypothetical protein
MRYRRIRMVKMLRVKLKSGKNNTGVIHVVFRKINFFTEELPNVTYFSQRLPSISDGVTEW